MLGKAIAIAIVI